MVPGSAPGSTSREGDLTTSAAEQRPRTSVAAPAARSGIAGPAPGDVLKNRFVLHQCLAEGTTSRLFRALDRRREASGDPDPWVVLKVVTAAPGPAGDRQARAIQALRREAAIALGLEHPNLPRIIGIDDDGPHTFVCMAWLEGESLAAILDSRGPRPMTRVQALHILEGIGRALVHLHARGITHADVKPGNVLVTPQGEATLLDFGVAVRAGDLPAVRGFTPEYASPEVLAGHEPTPLDDLFSLACVAYRMLAGHRAFGAVTAADAAATGSRPSRPGHVSPAQWRALDRALAFGRAERQPDVATFLAQLKGVRDESLLITDLPATRPEPPPAAPPPPAPGTRGWRRLLVAATLLLTGAGIFRALWPPPAPDPVPLPATAASPASSPPRVDESQAREQVPIPLAPDRSVPVPPPRRPVPAAAPRVPITGPPRELAGPPVPEPAAIASARALPAPAPADLPPGGALADTTTAIREVPFSSLTIRRYVEPDYPRRAAARRVPGWVDVAFTVDLAGRTQAVRVIGADPPGLFDEAALAAVRRWRFGDMKSVAGTSADSVHSRIRLRFEPAGAPGRR